MSEHRTSELPNTLRWTVGLLGVFLVIGAFVMLYWPPETVNRELDGGGAIIKILSDSRDVTTPFLATFLTGVALFVFAVNGLRFAKITAAGVSAEAPNETEAAQKYYETTPENRPKEEVVNVSDKDSPEPTEIPTGLLNEGGDRYAVYKLHEVPSAVIQDALTSWPSGDSKPEDLSGFEFATRKTGKGNHPWTLKFKGKKAVTVTYGGFAKLGPTVAQAQ